MDRGALVKAMAICTRHPFIQIFKVSSLMCGTPLGELNDVLRSVAACASHGTR